MAVKLLDSGDIVLWWWRTRWYTQRSRQCTNECRYMSGIYQAEMRLFSSKMRMGKSIQNEATRHGWNQCQGKTWEILTEAMDIRRRWPCMSVIIWHTCSCTEQWYMTCCILVGLDGKTKITVLHLDLSICVWSVAQPMSEKVDRNRNALANAREQCKTSDFKKKTSAADT